jgi:hypothetical protein
MENVNEVNKRHGVSLGESGDGEMETGKGTGLEDKVNEKIVHVAMFFH